MSADRYSECPKCIKKHKDAFEQCKFELAALYGAVPADEYNSKLIEASRKLDYLEVQSETLREDYEFYLVAMLLLLIALFVVFVSFNTV